MLACLSPKWPFDKIAFSFSVLCVPADWPQGLVLAESVHTRCMSTRSLSPALCDSENASRCQVCTLLPHILFAYFSEWLFPPSHLWGVRVDFKWRCFLPAYKRRGFFLLCSVVTGRCVLVTSNCNRISQSGCQLLLPRGKPPVWVPVHQWRFRALCYVCIRVKREDSDFLYLLVDTFVPSLPHNSLTSLNGLVLLYQVHCGEH